MKLLETIYHAAIAIVLMALVYSVFAAIMQGIYYLTR